MYEALFMIKLSNTDAELKKSVASKQSKFKETGSHANPGEFGWRIDGDATFKQDKMLLLTPKHYTLRCG